MKELSKSINKCIRDKKKVKRQQVIQKNREDFKGVSNIPRIKPAKKKVLITKFEHERGEIIMSRKGIATVFGEFYKKLNDDNEQDECGNESNIDIHISDTEEMTRISDSKMRSGNSKKVNHQTATGFEQKTSKLVTRRRKKWRDRSSMKS